MASKMEKLKCQGALYLYNSRRRHRDELTRRHEDHPRRASHDDNARGPWLTTAASGSCRLKSGAAIDVEEVPVAHHADESSRLRSARIC